MKYRITNKIHTTKWYLSPDLAWEKYQDAIRRKGYPVPNHIPGKIFGDEHWNKEKRIAGIRDGLGNVFLEWRD